MNEKNIFVYKLFYVKTATTWKKSPLFPSNPPLNVKILSRPSPPPPYENLVGGSIPPSPSRKRGGCTLSDINKSVNKDLRSLVHWLNATKISLNVTKTEVVIFRAKGKVFDTDLKLKMRGKKFYSPHHVKYLEVYLDEYLNWVTRVNQFV